MKFYDTNYYDALKEICETPNHKEFIMSHPEVTNLQAMQFLTKIKPFNVVSIDEGITSYQAAEWFDTAEATVVSWLRCPLFQAKPISYKVNRGGRLPGGAVAFNRCYVVLPSGLFLMALRMENHLSRHIRKCIKEDKIIPYVIPPELKHIYGNTYPTKITIETPASTTTIVGFNAPKINPYKQREIPTPGSFTSPSYNLKKATEKVEAVETALKNASKAMTTLRELLKNPETEKALALVDISALRTL